MLAVVHVLDQIDHVVAVEVTHRLRQHLRCQHRDHFVADALIQFRQDVAVELAIIEPDQPRTVIGVDLFQKVGDVRRVQRIHQFDQLGLILDVDRIQNRADRFAVQLIGLVRAFFLDLGVLFNRIEFVSHGPVPALRPRP